MTGLMFNTLRDVLLDIPFDGVGKEIAQHCYEDSPAWPKFVFPNSIPEGAFDFGRDLFFEGMLDLPFPKCFLQRYMPYYAETVGYFALSSHEDATVFVAVAKRGGFGPVALSRDGSVTLNQWSKVKQASQEEVKRAAASEAASVMAMIGFLNTKGTTLETVSPKPGVNAKRARQGKRHIPEYTVVKIDPEIIKRYANGGTHTSPRPHLRRGHIRRLDEERKTVVRPSFVNADGSLIPPPQYRVETAKENK